MKAVLKKKSTIAIVVMTLLVGSIVFTTDMSLRAAVFLKSPVSAFTMKYKYVRNESDHCYIYEITENAPYGKLTGIELGIWAVYKYGPLHFTKYFGWG